MSWWQYRHLCGVMLAFMGRPLPARAALRGGAERGRAARRAAAGGRGRHIARVGLPFDGLSSTSKVLERRGRRRVRRRTFPKEIVYRKDGYRTDGAGQARRRKAVLKSDAGGRGACHLLHWQSLHLQSLHLRSVPSWAREKAEAASVSVAGGASVRTRKRHTGALAAAIRQAGERTWHLQSSCMFGGWG